MSKIKIIAFIVILAVFCSCDTFNNPTDGVKVEGNIANSEDCSHIIGVKAYLYNPVTVISESNLENNYFSLFLPYELSNKLQKQYCSTVSVNEYQLFDSKFESYLTFSNKDAKIAVVEFSEINKNIAFNFLQFGYTEKFYDNEVATVTLAKTKYVYAQSAVSVKGKYESYIAGSDQDGNPIGPKTVKVDLLLQKGWNIVYNIGNFTSKPNTFYWSIDTAILNITTIRPENIELKWFYNSSKIENIMRNDEHFVYYLPYMSSYYGDFIMNQY